MRPQRWAVRLGGLFFLSGAAALGYEVAWGRAALPAVGVHAWAGMIITGAVLLGLGLGAAAGPGLLRRFVGQWPPLRLYGLLEIAAAVMAAPVPVVLQLLTTIPTGLETSVPWLRLIIATGIISLPFLVMGAGFPVMVKIAEKGPVLAYGTNALGAACGCLVTGYLTLPYLGVVGAHLAAVAMSLGAGLGALRLSETHFPSPLPSPARGEGTRIPLPTPPHGGGDESGWRGDKSAGEGMVVAAMAGFFAAGAQVLLARCLILGIGFTPYALTITLAVSLLAVAGGAGIAALVRRGEKAVLILGGVLTLAWVYGGEVISNFFSLRPMSAGSWENAQMLLMGRALVTAGPPLLAFSTILPILLGRLGGPGAAGRLYSANAVASAVGAFVTGAVLLPRWGLSGSLLGLGTGALVLGIVLAAASIPAPSELQRWVRAGSLGLAGGLGIMTLPQDWSFALLNNQVRTNWSSGEGPIEGQILYARDGLQGTVAVIHSRDNTMGLFMHGKAEASTYAGDVQNQKLLGHLPALLWRAGNSAASLRRSISPSLAIVVGWGTGMTSRALARHPFRVETLELSPEVAEAGEFFRPFDVGFVNRGTMRLRRGDARLIMGSYPGASAAVITSDPFNPWTAGAGSLYTREYFQEALRVLAEDGVMAVWVPLYQMPVRELRRLFGTFRSVFPEVGVWSAESDLILTGSRKKIPLSVEVLKDLWTDEAALDLGRIGLPKPADLVASRIAELSGPDMGAPPWHSDFSPRLEYGSARAYVQFTVPTGLREMAFLAGNKPDTAFVRAMLEAKALRWENRILEAVEKLEEARVLSPESSEARDLLARFLAMQAWDFAVGGQRPAALALYRRAEGLGMERQDLLSVWGALLAWAGYRAEAEPVLLKALQLWPGDIRAWHAYGDSLMKEGSLWQASLALSEAVRQVPYNGASWYRLAQAASRLGQADVSKEAFQIAIRNDPKLKDSPPQGRVTTGAGEQGNVKTFKLPG